MVVRMLGVNSEYEDWTIFLIICLEEIEEDLKSRQGMKSASYGISIAFTVQIVEYLLEGLNASPSSPEL
jgi:hypothetical protein